MQGSPPGSASAVKPVFVLLGLALLAYTGIATVRGEVVAKSGPGMRRLRRDEHAVAFWSVVAIYAGLALALLFLF